MLMIPFVREYDGSLKPQHHIPVKMERLQPEHLSRVYGGGPVSSEEINAVPPYGYSLWRGRTGSVFAFSMEDEK